MKISSGGQTDSLPSTGKIKEIKVLSNSSSKCIELWINDTSLSYLSIEEALNLRDELQQALKTNLHL